jgi:hypothetical protein
VCVSRSGFCICFLMPPRGVYARIVIAREVSRVTLFDGGRGVFLFFVNLKRPFEPDGHTTL